MAGVTLVEQVELQTDLDAGAKGVIVAGAGAGALSGDQRSGLTYAMGKGVFVVTTTRTGAGRIAVRAGGRGRAGGGPVYRINGDDLTPIKARIPLMLALATTTDGATTASSGRDETPCHGR